MQRLWYVAYGSNLSLERFTTYLRGGQPAGGARDHPGSRDPRPPERDVPLMIAGGLRFVGASSVWGGGMAIYDARASGDVAARAYLITADQFVDVLAQEMRLDPGLEIDLAPARETGWHSLGPGHYETVGNLGSHDGLPMFTFTSADVDNHPVNAPTAGYLRTIAHGLKESHGWSGSVIGRYLARFPGVAGAWSEAAIEGLAS
jgi:hypothetical protein